MSVLQQLIKDALKLEFQLEHIDYNQRNFVHADATPELFMQKMKERGENFFSLIIKLLLRSSELESKNPELSAEFLLMQYLLDSGKRFGLRKVLARQFENLELLSEIFDGKDGSVIISERNKIAIQVLKREIKKGKKRLGIYYGAGHLPDLEKRLLQELGLQCSEHRWIEAWQLQ